MFDVVGWSMVHTYIYQYGPHDKADCICAGGGWNMVLGQAKADCMRL